MKKLIFLLLLLPTFGLAQSKLTFFVRQDTAAINLRAYASGTVDTCQAIDAANSSEVWLSVQTTDTASIHFKLLRSADGGTTWTPVSSAIDSASIAAPTGGIRTVNIKSFVGNSKFRLVFNQTAFQVPVAGTHLYTARMTLVP